MKEYVEFTLFVMVVTCQAHNLLPLYHRQSFLRQGVLDHPVYYNSWHPNLAYHPVMRNADQTTEVAQSNENSQSTDDGQSNENAQTIEDAESNQDAQLSDTELEAFIDEIDKEALNKISKKDRDLLLSQLSIEDRKALLLKYFADLNPVNENRFNVSPTALATVAANIGASAGRYIGNQLAGSLGSQLGEAAGSYLGEAAAIRILSAVPKSVQIFSRNAAPVPIKPHPSNSGNYGAAVIRNK